MRVGMFVASLASLVVDGLQESVIRLLVSDDVSLGASQVLEVVGHVFQRVPEQCVLDVVQFLLGHGQSSVGK